MKRNLRLLLEYDGTAFKGWQVQPDQRTVQGELENALQKLLRHPIRTVAAGRTDAGVHARGQVANFHTANPLEIGRIAKALNSLLPPDVVVRRADEVPQAFNSRWDARRRAYSYQIEHVRGAIDRSFVWWVRASLNTTAMQEATQRLLGLHDFTSFCVAASEKENRLCHVFSCNLDKQENGFRISIEANRFLRAMVRGIVGTLIQVGRGTLRPEDLTIILEARDRQCAGPNAPPQGLFLEHVYYEVPPGG
ncbi:MAG: tRNA pseudouridine(38-40) synthase TruA [bacterium]|nr:tRNA pseudouridine(38-40) synthase TruA [bacterium]